MGTQGKSMHAGVWNSLSARASQQWPLTAIGGEERLNWFTKLPGSHHEPPGLERRALRKLPVYLLGGTLIPLFFSVASHLVPPGGSASAVARHLKLVEILSIATVVTVWTAAFTVAIGCIVVVIMKGPAYVADRYELSDSDEPKPD
jgi:hypothetical protein